MATASVRLFDCTPDDVFAVLGDGWLYPVWVVGAARMRDVDPEWPAEGAHIHHSLGGWPILLDDDTQIVEWSPPHRMKLRAKAGPLGRGVVVIEVKPRGTGCVVRLGEEPVAFVSTRPEMAVSEPELIAFVAQRLARFKVPVEIFVRHQPLPRNANGKILKNELKKEVA